MITFQSNKAIVAALDCICILPVQMTNSLKKAKELFKKINSLNQSYLTELPAF